MFYRMAGWNIEIIVAYLSTDTKKIDVFSKDFTLRYSSYTCSIIGFNFG